jgi:hypothetical protein
LFRQIRTDSRFSIRSTFTNETSIGQFNVFGVGLSPRTIINGLDNAIMISTMLTSNFSTFSVPAGTSTEITNALTEVTFTVSLVFPSILRVSQVVVVIQTGRDANSFTDWFITTQTDLSTDLLLTRTARFSDIVFFLDTFANSTTVVGASIFNSMFFTVQTLESRDTQVHELFAQNIIFFLSTTTFFRNTFSFHATAIQISGNFTFVGITQGRRSHAFRTLRTDSLSSTVIFRIDNTFTSLTALRFTFKTDSFLNPRSTNDVFNTIDETVTSVSAFNLGTAFELIRRDLTLIGTTRLYALTEVTVSSMVLNTSLVLLGFKKLSVLKVNLNAVRLVNVLSILKITVELRLSVLKVLNA